MLSLIESWHCDIWPGLARLRRGERVVAVHSRAPRETLDDSVEILLSQRSRAIPWRDELTFHLDTDALDFLIQPWLPGVSTPQELRQLAQQQAARELRQSVNWLTGFESATWQHSALVACLEQSSQIALATAARRHHLRFQGIVTPFQALFAKVGAKLPEAGLFVTVAPGHTRIASRQQKLWQSVWSLKLRGQESTEQLLIIRRLSRPVQAPCYVLELETGAFFIESSQECAE